MVSPAGLDTKLQETRYAARQACPTHPSRSGVAANRIEDHLAGAVVIALGILALLAAFAG